MGLLIAGALGANTMAMKETVLARFPLLLWTMTLVHCLSLLSMPLRAPLPKVMVTLMTICRLNFLSIMFQALNFTF